MYVLKYTTAYTYTHAYTYVYCFVCDVWLEGDFTCGGNESK